MRCIVEVRGEGPDLVLLHGWGFGSNLWNGIVDGLARNFRVALVELPGYPRNRVNGSKGFDDILECLALELPKGSHLLGWSLGGMFALALARRLPGRFGKGVFVSTNLRFTACDGWSNAMQAETLEKFQHSLRKDVAATLQRFGALTARGSAAGFAELRYFRQQLRERGLPGVDALAQGLAMLEKIDLRTPESASDSEMLFIHGDNDALTPARVAADIRSLLPDARTVVFRSAGHAPFLAYRQKFIDIVTDFLA
jgi:pimeloyl-[acyl-carrier protein] methyl ester esterase